MFDDLTLSRRAVAVGWKWRPGALVWGGDRITEDTLGVAHGVVPDFNDAPTRGVLLQQVRERWGDPWLCVAWTGMIWICVDRHGIGLEPPCRADSETAALVAAMESAPKR